MRILSVDDQPQNLRLMERLLTRAGHVVVSAANGVEALEQLRQGSFDLIISDILMPQMDGFQFCRKVKQDPALHHIPLIFHTATYTDRQDEELAASLGAARFIPKPTGPEKLLEIVNEVLRMAPVQAGPPAVAGDEQAYLRTHNERLIHKLEQKVSELSELSSRLQTELDARTRETAARARAEAILREAETRYRIVAEQTGHLIYDYDIPTGRIIWHGAVRQLVGWELEEFQAVDLNAWEEMIHRDDRVRTLSELEAVMQSGRDYAVEYRFRRKDGSFVHVEDHGAFMKDAQGKITRMLGSMGDISARVQAEQNLRESEALYRSLVDHLPLGLFVKSSAGKYTFANRRFTELTSLPLPAVLGCTDRDLFPATRAAEYQAGDDAVLHTGTMFQAEETYRRRDGTEITLRVIKTPVRDAAGRVVGVQGMLWDVTDQKRAEADRGRLEAQLQHTQKMEALGKLAGGISHDFNNILAAIFLNVDQLQAQIPEGTEARLSLAEIEKASLRARSVVRQVLSFSRREEPHKTPTHLQVAVKETLSLLRATLPSTIEFRCHLADDCPLVLADVSQIHQSLINLASNAGYAMRERGGVFECRVEHRVVEADFAQAHPPLRPGAHVCLSVSDSGCGMDAETLKRVFEPYFTTKPPGEGTGLGLAVVHGIVRSHEGAIAVRSEPGKGTRFDLYFPVCVSDPPVSQAAAPTAANARGERIMVVDDEQSIARAGEIMLKRLGYQPVVFTDPEHALAAFRQAPHDFDAVVTDLTMPRLTGIALAEEIRRVRGEVPVILTTGFLANVDMNQIRQAGVVEVVGKPFRAQDLAAVLSRILTRTKSGE